MASSLAKQPHHHQSIRSNSASSSSAVTVQRAASTRTGPRPTVSGLRSQSPNEINSNPANRSVHNISPDIRRRSSAGHNRPDSSNGMREGVGNLNRWSQSTVSSNSSATHHGKSSFSKRLSGSFGSFGAFANPHSSSPNGKGASRSGLSASASPDEPVVRTPSKQAPAQPPKQPPPTLPPIVTLSSLSQAVDAADSPSTANTATPATADLLLPATYQPERDYFGHRWRARSPLSQPDSGPPLQKTSPIPSPAFTTASSKPNLRSLSPNTEPTAKSTDKAVSKNFDRNSVQQRKRRREPRSSYSRGRGEERARSSEDPDDPVSGKDRRGGDRRVPSQKAMLSKALQKAKQAVLLDNAQNFEGAMHAYSDACELLERVMRRSSQDEYRMKLESVVSLGHIKQACSWQKLTSFQQCTTYSNRINELRNSDMSYQPADEKALPSRPGGRDTSEQEPISPLTDEEDEVITSGHATAARSVERESMGVERRHLQDMTKAPSDIPLRRHSLRPVATQLEDGASQPRSQLQPGLRPQDQPPWWNGPALQRPIISRARTLESTTYQRDMPPPLSPRRLPSASPSTQNPPRPPSSSRIHNPTDSGYPNGPNHARQETSESTSWLDTIDESGGSSASSVHSRTSSIGLRRKKIRAARGATEAEFDAALDAAVEAAYDDGFEPAQDDYYDPDDILDVPYEEPEPIDYFSEPRQNIELAKERVREAEREAAISAAKQREKQRLQGKSKGRASIDSGLSDDEAEDEERMLEEMTRGYVLDSEYNMQSKSALPRQSDSSGFSGRTWGTSISSNPTSAGTSFSVPAGAPALPSLPAELQGKQIPPPAHPPPSGALPSLPNPALSGSSPVKPANGAPPGSRTSNPGVRERRLSGLRATQLKIDTNAKTLSSSVAPAPKTQPLSLPAPLLTPSVTEPPKSAFAVPDSQQAQTNHTLPSPATTATTQGSTRKGAPSLPTPGSVETTPNTIPPMPALHQVTTNDSEDSVPSVPDSPARLSNKSSAGPGMLRKNFSSSSLKKMLTISVPDLSETGSTTSTSRQRKTPVTAVPALPTPKGADFIIEAIPSGGMHLFDREIHSPVSPGMPNLMAVNAPSALEPCPQSTLLRPFWFLRFIHQSITHPRGAYISTRLFIPRDIWKVTNVKLKNVEDKVSACDHLTAKLLNLAKVNTFDANAVLEEMQGLEHIMEQYQAILSKKLGSEVGVSNAAWLAKGPGEANGNIDVFGAKSSTASTKSYLSSWRKKMSKSSSMGPGYAASTMSSLSKNGGKEAPTMTSVPMTTSQQSRYPRRDLGQVQYVGPHSHYMGALARLCDAAQFLDQIARGVEDPGLKHSSPTHVGLELSMRHAAEFFGFYICRFILNDLSMMLDKFIKRGSQWVLA
ncbi:MAG: hypothetical protein Q9197_005801 [Variospora fuerteventurae]